MQEWQCNFKTATNIGSSCNCPPKEDEWQKTIDKTLCGWFNVYPEGYQWNGTGIEERPKETLEAMQLVDRRKKIQAENKSSCRAHILSKYPLEIQSSAALGVYPEEQKTLMADFIAACVEEENKVFDKLEAASSLEALALVAKPVWPEA